LGVIVENNYLTQPEKTEFEIAKQILKNSKDPAEREKAQQKYDTLREKDISSDKDKQQQDVATLSRDTDNANGSIAPIFD